MKEKKIRFLNYSLLIVSVILSFGGVTTCCLSYGHGLGDIVYLFPLWFLTFLYFILVIFFKNKIKSKGFIPVIYVIILSFFIINITLNKGPECSCNLFSKKNYNPSKTEIIESIEDNNPDTTSSNIFTKNKNTDTLKVIVVQCVNGYECAMHNYDFNPIIEKVDVNYLILTKFIESYDEINSSKINWGYETKIINTKTMEQINSIGAKKLNKYEQIEEHIKNNIKTL